MGARRVTVKLRTLEPTVREHRSDVTGVQAEHLCRGMVWRVTWEPPVLTEPDAPCSGSQDRARSEPFGGEDIVPPKPLPV